MLPKSSEIWRFMNVISTTSTTSQDYDVPGLPVKQLKVVYSDWFRSLCCIACNNMNGCCCNLILFLNSIVFRRAFFPSHTTLLYLKVCLPDAEMQQQARNRKGRHSAEHAAFQHPAKLHLRPHMNSCVSRAAKSKDISAHQTALEADHCTKHVI